jgi:nucleotide-binding universal stress UspA family protein
MKRILIPIDGSEQSMRAIDFVKSIYNSDTVEISVVMVCENLETMRSKGEIENAKSESKNTLFAAAQRLKDYTVSTKLLFGRAGDEIIKYADANQIEAIAMTKSSKRGWSTIIGSVATYIVNHAKCVVMIVPDSPAI